MDPYKVLGVSPDASEEEIKKHIRSCRKSISPRKDFLKSKSFYAINEIKKIKGEKKNGKQLWRKVQCGYRHVH